MKKDYQYLNNLNNTNNFIHPYKLQKSNHQGSGLNKFIKYKRYGLIQKLKDGSITYENYLDLKGGLNNAFNRLVVSIKNINKKYIDMLNFNNCKKYGQKPLYKQKETLVNQPTDQPTNLPIGSDNYNNDRNKNDIEFILNTFKKSYAKSLDIINKQRPHLSNIIDPLVLESMDLMKTTLYETIKQCKLKNIILSSYKENIGKLVIVGDVPIKDNIDTFKQINKYFGITLPSCYSPLYNQPRYKELRKLLEKITFSCNDYVLSMTDKTKRPLVVCSKLYQSENNKHFGSKYKYIGEYEDLKELIIVEKNLFVFEVNNKNGEYCFPTSYILFKEHKKEPISESDDFVIYNQVPSRQIITYPHCVKSDWSETLHYITKKMIIGFSNYLKNSNIKYLNLMMIKDSFNLYTYLNNIDYRWYNNNDYFDFVYPSIYKTYDVVELYDNLSHDTIERVVDRCEKKYKIINTDEKEIIKLHLKSLYVRFGSHIFKQEKGLPMGAHLSPILSMILILDVCIKYKFDNVILFVDDCKLLFSCQKTVDRWKRCIEKELGLKIQNGDDSKFLELSIMDINGEPKFYYNIDEQRKHKNNQLLSIPNNYMRYESKCITNPNISVIKGYMKKIDKMSLLPEHFYKNTKSLTNRCFNSGHLMNYVLSRRNVYKRNKEKKQLISKEIILYNKKLNKEIIIEKVKDGLRLKKYRRLVDIKKRLVEVLINFSDSYFKWIG
jgi:hypothetical protein